MGANGFSEDDVVNAVARYERERDRYSKMADAVYELCLDIVKDSNVRATVQRRTKTAKSLEGKLKRKLKKNPPNGGFTDLDSVFKLTGDLAAVRIATYLDADRQKIVDEIKKTFELPGEKNPETKESSEFGKHYHAIHCEVLLKAGDLQDGQYSNLAGTSCEIQVCSMMAHVWNEIEHDIVYKPLGEASQREKECLETLGKLARASDVLIKTLLDASSERIDQEAKATREKTTHFDDVHAFVARTRQLFPKLARFAEHAPQLFDVLQELKIVSIAEIEKQLLSGKTSIDLTDAEKKGGQLQEYLKAQREPNLSIELDTSDMFAVICFSQKAEQIIQTFPSGRGLGRPMRIVSLAKRFLEMERAAQSSTSST